MADEKTASEYNIEGGATLHLVRPWQCTNSEFVPVLKMDSHARCLLFVEACRTKKVLIVRDLVFNQID